MKTLYDMMEEVEMMFRDNGVSDFGQDDPMYFDLHEESGVVTYHFRFPEYHKKFHLVVVAKKDYCGMDNQYRLLIAEGIYILGDIMEVEDTVTWIISFDQILNGGQVG